ncbi:hypothetical protein QSI_3912 [Clostridioides difficile P28]|nr:hypothetical protein QSI_3912 [Clostridioides difficile P28]
MGGVIQYALPFFLHCRRKSLHKKPASSKTVFPSLYDYPLILVQEL